MHPSYCLNLVIKIFHSYALSMVPMFPIIRKTSFMRNMITMGPQRHQRWIFLRLTVLEELSRADSDPAFLQMRATDVSLVVCVNCNGILKFVSWDLDRIELQMIYQHKRNNFYRLIEQGGLSTSTDSCTFIKEEIAIVASICSVSAINSEFSEYNRKMPKGIPDSHSQ
uniref:Mis18 domain-containing protein n=1 Tax=Heterorhabditis bacteriophora TaxID=37862 RepID=A0A1I7WQL9_HETBA